MKRKELSMSDQVWYEVDALTADLTSRRYRVLATSEEDAERKMRDRCPAAVAILVLEGRAAACRFRERMEVVAAAKVPLGPGWMWAQSVNLRVHLPGEADGHHC